MPHEFVGREVELALISAHADSSGILNLRAAPSSGVSELLRQMFDETFRAGGDVVPLYFRFKRGENALDAANRFAYQFLAQAVAFKRRDVRVIRSAAEVCEIGELALPEDAIWVDRMIDTCRSDSRLTDLNAQMRSALSSPLRAAAFGVRPLILIDGVHRVAEMPEGERLLNELIDIYENADVPSVFAGLRRYDGFSLTSQSLDIDPLTLNDAVRLAEQRAAALDVITNAETLDLMCVQLGCKPSPLISMIDAAAAREASLDSFAEFERIYTDEIFGFAFGRQMDRFFDRIVPNVSSEAKVFKLIAKTLSEGSTEISEWQRNAGLAADTLVSTIERLKTYEIVNVSAGRVYVDSDDTLLTDHICGRRRLEIDGQPRAKVIGSTAAANVERAPQLMARHYRRQSAVGLRELMNLFAGQSVPAMLFDNDLYKAELKGLDTAEQNVKLAAATEFVELPMIVFTAHTGSMYPSIGEIIDRERSAIAFGSEDKKGIRVWIAAEIDSKLEATRESAEFWLDRLEMAALSCGADEYKIWLIAPEGFTADALAAIGERGAVGTSRAQIELLRERLNGVGNMPGRAERSYELVIPMNADAEMIAAHTAEEIAVRIGFSSKKINQIKTAIVEACINAGEHSLSPDRRVRLTFEPENDAIKITVTNRGVRLADKLAAAEPESDEPDRRRGWGLQLMSKLMDDVRITPVDDGTSIIMRKAV